MKQIKHPGRSSSRSSSPPIHDVRLVFASRVVRPRGPCYYGSAASSSRYANSYFPPDDKLELATFIVDIYALFTVIFNSVYLDK